MILPGATVGVLGGGQLGRMFAMRARTTGYRVVVLDPDRASPAGAVADEQIVAAYDDPQALDQLADCCAAVTTEFENVPAAALERLARRIVVSPSARAVSIAQDRLAEKAFLKEAGFPVAAFSPVRNRGDVAPAASAIGFPAILKTNRLGYDGKGQATVAAAGSLASAFEGLGGVECILEERLRLECELSVVLARGADGALAAFPAGENTHRDGVLETTVVPAGVEERIAREAGELASAVATALDYVGVLGVEMFVANGGRLYVNEIAPRPHNSGHYTLDACSTDQFEQQLRALCGLPLAEPRLLSPVTMINLLGDLWTAGEPRWVEAFRSPGARLHLYGKQEPRPGRKMGHLTCLASSGEDAFATAHAIHAALAGG